MLKQTRVIVFLAIVIAGAAWSLAGRQDKSRISGNIADAVESNGRPVATAIVAGGCFWCVESDFEKLPGVRNVVSGYSGGTGDNPTYKNYSQSAHVEVVEVSYDPTQVSYAGIVEWLVKHSDPTDGDGSFGDRGPEYRPVVYYQNEDEKQTAQRVLAEINELAVYDKPLAVSVERRQKFWPAEDYHQDYHSKSLLKYDFYRYQSGRDAFINKHWGDRAAKLELDGSVPEAVAADSIADDVDGTDGVDGIVGAAKNAKPWIGFSKPAKEELQKLLNDLQYSVTQEEGTERPFANEYWENESQGIYVDVVSGEPLFSSADKFKSGTGWPSFVRPIDSQFIKLLEDKGLFSIRTEVRSKIADSHLGHVFDDGPVARGGKRWCMNSASMTFVPKDQMIQEGYGDYLDLIGD